MTEEIIEPKTTPVKYDIAGKPKVFTEYEPDVHCKFCDDGKIFNKEYFMFDEFEEEEQEKICEACMTKYKFPKEKVICKISSLYKPSNDSYLTKRSAEELFKEIRTINEEDKMEYLKAREEFMQTGKCPGHQLVRSKPFNTAEGTFQILSCRICKLGEVEYKGKKYQDNIMNLLNFLGQQGIKKDLLVTKELEHSKFLSETEDVSFDQIEEAVEDISFDEPEEQLTFL